MDYCHIPAESEEHPRNQLPRTCPLSLSSGSVEGSSDFHSKHTRGSHTFSREASILGEVPRASLLLGARIWRSSHSPRISRSRSPPSTLENWTWRSFLGEVLILRLPEFTLCVAHSRCVGFLPRVLCHRYR